MPEAITKSAELFQQLGANNAIVFVALLLVIGVFVIFVRDRKSSMQLLISQGDKLQAVMKEHSEATKVNAVALEGLTRMIEVNQTSSLTMIAGSEKLLNLLSVHDTKVGSLEKMLTGIAGEVNDLGKEMATASEINALLKEVFDKINALCMSHVTREDVAAALKPLIDNLQTHSQNCSTQQQTLLRLTEAIATLKKG